MFFPRLFIEASKTSPDSKGEDDIGYEHSQAGITGAILEAAYHTAQFLLPILNKTEMGTLSLR